MISTILLVKTRFGGVVTMVLMMGCRRSQANAESCEET